VVVAFLAPQLEMPALTRFIDGTGPIFAGPVFPFCFITIACGAISGFHCLVASGTTPKLLASEADIRLVGYGAMITEMCVGVLALIAACAMPPGEYFAINLRGEPAAVVQRVTEMGFPVTEKQMEDLARSVGEQSMIGRTGGAPTFAVGMAQIFARSFGGLGAAGMAFWYHFAIMFEALFILTTIDAGTRIGRFILQELLGRIYKPLGDLDWLPASVLATGLIVIAWSGFIYTGSVETIWPMFGMANQLLAVVGLCLVTTWLINNGRARYAPATLLPMLFVLTTTSSAGYYEITRKFMGMVKQGQVFRGYLNIGLTLFVITCVFVILVIAVKRWIAVLSGRVMVKE